MASLPLPGLRRMAEPVWSTRLQTFLTVHYVHLCQGNWKRLILHQVLNLETSPRAVCRCKTIFRLVGPAKLKNNVSKMLIAKSQTSISIVYNYQTLRHAMTKMTLFPKSCIFIFWVKRPTKNDS